MLSKKDLGACEIKNELKKWVKTSRVKKYGLKNTG
jgi:hypothetical protein